MVAKSVPLQFAMACKLPLTIPEEHAFLDLAKQFNWEEVKQCVAERAELARVQPLGRDGTVRWSALHQAAYSGNAGAVQFLLRNNACPTAKTNDGKTPIEVASNHGVKQMLSRFLAGQASDAALNRAAGATISSTRSERHTSTQIATRAKGKKVAKVILKAKAKRAPTVVPKGKGKRGKALVYSGRFVRTASGLTKDKLTKSKGGRIVSLRMQTVGHTAYQNIKGWNEAFMKARVQLAVSGFVPLKKGSALYAKTVELYMDCKRKQGEDRPTF